MKKLKRYLSIALVLLLWLSSGTIANASYTGFDDVPISKWYAEPIAYCRATGLMNGVSETLFDPESHMNRAMMATVLYRVAGEPYAEFVPFDDVETERYYTEAVSWTAQTGIAAGYGDGQFGTDDDITREQIVTMLWRYEGCPVSSGDIAVFSDFEDISGWAVDAVAWAQETGVVAGMPDGTFMPKDCATRGQIAMIFRNYMRGTPFEYPENTYCDENFYTENGFLMYNGSEASAVGVDVSDWQGDIDWDRVAADGVEFAIIRAGYRGYSVGSIMEDDCFVQNIEGALNAGLDVGVYFFSQAITPDEAVEEANFLLEHVEGYDVTYPLVFDWERQYVYTSRTKNITGEVITACADAFCQTVAQAGYTPMVYGNPSDVPNNLDLSYLTHYPYWLAHYTSSWSPTSFPYNYSMWQYTSSGKVDGITGNVDLNLCLVNW